MLWPSHFGDFSGLGGVARFGSLVFYLSFSTCLKVL